MKPLLLILLLKTFMSCTVPPSPRSETYGEVRLKEIEPESYYTKLRSPYKSSRIYQMRYYDDLDYTVTMIVHTPEGYWTEPQKFYVSQSTYDSISIGQMWRIHDSRIWSAKPNEDKLIYQSEYVNEK